MTNKILNKMIDYNIPDLRRINHALKVYGYAKAIGFGENLDTRSQYILETAAILHDIGIHKAEEIYGSSAGKYQEELGPDIARSLLENLDYTADEIELICFIIGHHHSYNTEYNNLLQYIFEADFIVNADEDKFTKDAATESYNKIFKSATGSRLFENLILRMYKE